MLPREVRLGEMTFREAPADADGGSDTARLPDRHAIAVAAEAAATSMALAPEERSGYT
jgi:hypothetical protein